MARLSSFMFTSLNGYFKGPGEDLSWRNHDPEWSEYAAQGLQAHGTLVFGRITYDMMVAYWTMPEVMKNDPVVARGMNESSKIVFSRTLKKADWNNTKLLTGNLVEEMKKLKQDSGKDLTILGSGSIVAQLAEAGLIDEFQVLINPVAIGAGTPFLSGIGQQVKFRLTNTRVFKSGNVLLCYTSANASSTK